MLLLAASLAIVTTTAEAKPRHIKNKDDFKSCGGALKCLGAQKLGRVRRRSGLGHKSVQEIAALLDTDGDLVSAFSTTSWSAGACSSNSIVVPCGTAQHFVGTNSSMIWMGLAGRPAIGMYTT